MASIGSILMDSVGYGYDSFAVVKISKPNMPIIKPVLTANVSNTSISSVGVSRAGSYYIVTPVLTIPAPSDSSNKLAIVAPSITNPIQASNKVTGLSVTNAGKFYDSSGATTITISAPTGDSDKLAIIAPSITAGKVSALSITNDGKLYDSSTPPTIVISTPTGDSDKQATISLQYDSANGNVSGISVLSNGKLYDSSGIVTITISAHDSAGGTTATAVPVIVDNRISSITITESGSGYTSTPTATIAAPTLSLSNFIATGTLTTANNRVNSVVITNSGDFYTHAPTVTVSAPTLSLSDFNATANAIVVNNILDSARITDSGDFYTHAPTVTVSAATKTATDFTATGIVLMNQDDSGNSLASVNMTNTGRFYTTVPIVTVDSATGDSDYFRAVGFANYNLSARTISSISITKKGKYYNSDVTPVVTIAAPPLASFAVGEKVTHKLPNTTLHGEVSAYDPVLGKLSLIHVGAADGEYHTFTPSTDSDIVGAGGSKGGIISVFENNKISSNEQNEEFAANVSGTTLGFLDFSETNPFGDPGDT